MNREQLLLFYLINSRIATVFSFALILAFMNCCTPRLERSELSVEQAIQNPLPPEKAGELVGTIGENWLYGQGLGDTAITAGTILIFPPYAALVLGNAALSISGYEPIRGSDLLPEEERSEWCELYQSVASTPGKITAAVAGEEFRTKEVAKENIEKIVNSK